MMLKELDNTINQLLNLSRYNRSPDEKTVAINAASAELFKFIAGPVGEYSAGRPVSRINNQETSTTYALLSNFYRVTEIATKTNVVGSLVPVWDVLTDADTRLYDVELVSAGFGGSSKTVGVKVLPDNQIKQRLKSKLVPPTEEVPIGEYYPKFRYAITPEPTLVVAKYLVFPISCKIVYDENGQFDPTLSIETDWPDDAIWSLAVRAIKFLGINIPNPTIIQAANQMQQQLV